MSVVPTALDKMRLHLITSGQESVYMVTFLAEKII